MPWTLRDQEFESVSNLPASARYTYFVKKAADTEQVWSLKSPSGWVLAATDSGRESVPVWPHERYASACALGPWEGCTPAPISLADWLTKWIPGMSKDGRLVAIFQVPQGQGATIEPARLATDLAEELKNYE